MPNRPPRTAPDRPSHRGLRHLALNARDFEAMRRFYTDVLGFGVEWEPDGDNVYLTSGADNLALHRAAAGVPPPAAAGALDHLGLVVRRREDVDAWADYLTRRGIAVDVPPRTHRDGARSLYLSDPDGNRVQIIHHPPIGDARESGP